MYLDKEAILQSLTEDDIIKICVSLGSAKYKVEEKAIQFQTICHPSDGSEKSLKLYYYRDSKMFHCYTKCGDSFSVIELVIRAFKAKGQSKTWYQSLNYIATLTGKVITSDEKREEKTDIIDNNFLNKFNRKKREEFKGYKVYNENILNLFSYKPHEMFLNDCISRETLSEFEIGYWGKTNQITLPHRNVKGELIGIRGRYICPEDVEQIGKYVPLQVEGKFLAHSLGNNLYGIHINRERIKKVKKCLLFEGEKSVMQCHTIYGSNDFSLAVCGSNITAEHAKILMELGVSEVIIGFDKEFHENGTIEETLYRNALYKRIFPLIQYFTVTLLWDTEGLLNFKDSPTDHGEETLQKLLDKKITITSEDLEVMKEEVIINYDAEEDEEE